MKLKTINENRDFILKYLPNLDEVLKSNDINDFLDEWDWAIQLYGFTDYPSDHPMFGYSDLGFEMQDIYDLVYLENEDD